MNRRVLFRHFRIYFLVTWIITAIFGYARIQFSLADGGLNENTIAVQEFGPFWFMLTLSTFVALMMALLTSLVEAIIVNHVPIRRFPLWVSLIVGFVIQSAICSLVLTFATNFAQSLLKYVVGTEVQAMNHYEVGPMLVIMYFDLLLCALIIQVDQKLGPGNLWKLLTGKFYRPREEERIFMFIDLKDSTTIAERIGHLKFSQFLKDCYDDFSVVDRYHAEIYQYVGDEVVVSWPLYRGLKNNNFLQAFYAFAERLEERKPYYQETYGFTPFFKTGVNIGPVVVTEVGRIKSEISYHGDTLNTAARIQALCNDLKAQMLISEKLYRKVARTEGYDFQDAGEQVLKGKECDVRVYKVAPWVAA